MGRTLLFVGGVPNSARHRDIEHFFRGYGRITDITRRNGHTFVEFDRYRDAKDAVRELDGHRMMGERVIVDFAKEDVRDDGRRRHNDENHRRSRRHSRSRSRDRSRSRKHRDSTKKHRCRSKSRERSGRREERNGRHSVSRKISSSRRSSENKENVRDSKRDRSNRDSRRDRSRSEKRDRTNRDPAPCNSPTIKKDETINTRSGSLFEFNFIDSPSFHSCDSNDRLSLPGLPGDILERIFDFTEHSRIENLLRLRLVNKKMDQRILGSLNFTTLNLTIFGLDYFLNLKTAKRSWQTRYAKDGLWEVCQLVQGLNRWSTSVSVARIELNIHANVDEHIGAAIRALFQFNADQLVVHTTIVDPVEYPIFKYSTTDYESDGNLPQLDFSTLLVMSANIKEVSIRRHICSQIDAVDLSILWKTLAEGGCKLESFIALFDSEVAKHFVNTCFHVNVLRNDSLGTIEYQFPPHAQFPIQLYSYSTFPDTLVHFDGDLQTAVNGNEISFKKIGAEEKSDLLESLQKIKLNHEYRL